jgi:hypothetical protein
VVVKSVVSLVIRLIDVLSFDVDYPLDVDDEYWDTGNPETDFKQPANKPTKISSFISLLKLGRIIASAIMNVVRGLHEQGVWTTAERDLAFFSTP